MSRADHPLPQARRFGETSRRDAWWLVPVATFVGLGAFVVYSTIAALVGDHYYYGGPNGAHYLSPFYSPVLFDVGGQTSGHAWLGPLPGWWPAWLPYSPAILILWAPAGFRFTCYYYRGAYYKAFWADPPSCAVGEPRKGYRGEKSFPLILQNVHRYFLYIALVFIVILAWDAINAYRFTDATGTSRFGVGVGSIVLTINVFLLGGYTFGCHSLRHLVGGRFDCLAGRPVRKTCYDCVSGLNKRHMVWAWMSLFWVAFSDIYVRLSSMGVITDWKII